MVKFVEIIPYNQMSNSVVSGLYLQLYHGLICNCVATEMGSVVKNYLKN